MRKSKYLSHLEKKYAVCKIEGEWESQKERLNCDKTVSAKACIGCKYAEWYDLGVDYARN